MTLTTGVNLAMVLTSATTGALLARSMGPQIRGDYAAVTAWFWVVLVITELGQAAAVTYFAAREPEDIPATLASSRRLMVIAGILVTATGWFAVPALAHGSSDLVSAYRIMLVATLGTLVTTADSAALQALNVGAWNIVRASQPLLYLCGVGAVIVARSHIGLVAACLVLAVTVEFQGLLAWTLRHRQISLRGRFERTRAQQLGRYGASQLVGSGPALVNTRLDQLVLSQSARSSTLGQYAVAVTVTSLVGPSIAAVGNLLFPRLAASARTPEVAMLIRRSLRRTCLVAFVVSMLLAGSAYWAVPLVFGPSFTPAVGLIWALTPAGIALALGLVAADVLRGSGRPLAVARAQWGGAIVTIALLAVLIPPYGAYGAAIASGVAYLLTLTLLLFAIRDEIAPRKGSDG